MQLNLFPNIVVRDLVKSRALFKAFGFMNTRVFEDFVDQQWEWAWLETAQFEANE